jgi:phage minor structural protein
MITVFDKSMNRVAILENAFRVGYEKRYNELWFANITLPLDDPKNAHCKPFYFVEIIDKYDEYIGLFRIMPNLIKKNSSSNEVEYSLQHVIGTLLSDVIEGYEQTINWTTRQNIEFLLDFQTTRHWVLKDCEFTRYFHYKWESENGLLAPLFSIPQPFEEEFEWTWNTQVYPFELSLVKPSQELEWAMRYGHNIIGIEKEEDPTEIVNRIYPRGVGEGVNQLTIKDVNNGKTYLEDTASIEKYGLHSYVWIDRRIENAATLKGNGQSLLNQWKDPKVVYRANAADLSSITGETIDKHRLGKKGRIYDPDLGTIDKRVMSERKDDIFGSEGIIDLEIGSLTDDIATVQSDVERKIQTNEAYSQGSTNLMNFDYNDNADSTHPAIIRFYVPEEAVKINKLDLTFETTDFRAYGRATQSGGSNVITTTSAGGGGQTTSSGGGQTTSSGGGQTSSAGGDHKHKMFTATGFLEASNPNSSVILRADNGRTIAVDSDTAAGVEYYTEGSSGAHAHEVDDHVHHTDDHVHEVDDHAHQVKVTIPPHSHELDHGIFTLDTTPSKVTIKVDGTTVTYTSKSGDNIDLVPYLDTDSEGKITRGTYHTLEIKPDGLGRINAQVFMQLFLQSRGQYTA